MAPSTTSDAPDLRSLLQSWQKSLRTLSIYLPNNPVRQQAIDALQEGLSGLFEQLSEFSLTVSDAGLTWNSEIVLPVKSKSDSLAWTLFRDGIRWMTFSAGAEAEIVTFLGLVQRARTLTDEDEDDLLTLLWSADFQFIRYKVAELGHGDGESLESMAPADADTRLTADALRALLLGDTVDLSIGEESEEESQEEGLEEGQEEGQEGGAGPKGEDAPSSLPRPKGIVNLADYESTLYFLDEQEIDYLKDEVRREYQQNLYENILSMLFDVFEEQTEAEARAEVITTLNELLPHLLNAGEFHSVAYLISEAQVVLSEAEGLLQEHRKLMAGLAMTFSKSEAVDQLLEAIETATILPSAAETEELFSHLTPAVLSTVLMWHGRISNEGVRETLERAVDRMAQESPAAVGVALESSERVVVIEALRLVTAVALEGVGDQLVGLVGRDDVRIRNALVRALVAAPTSQTMRALVKLIEDPDSEVRTSAVRAVAMRRYKGALAVLESAVLGAELRSRDLTERRAFFQAYGTIAGESGVSNLKQILLHRAFRKSVDSETRACAAMALGRVSSQEARGALQKATKDRDHVVRSAAMRALQKDTP